MFSQEKKRRVRLSDFQCRLLAKALLCWRNDLLKEDKPTEDIDELILLLLN